MDVFEAILARKSVRAYDSKPVPNDVLMKVLEAGRLAPSASNRQPWFFMAVTDPEKRKALTGGPYAKFLKESPVVIVGIGDPQTSAEWHVVDVTIALTQMVLAATNEGLGTCWIGSFYEDKVKEALGIPGRLKVVAMLAVGYPREKMDLGAKILRMRNRKPMEEILSFDQFGNPVPKSMVKPK
jgi:nitroreductase